MRIVTPAQTTLFACLDRIVGLREGIPATDRARARAIVVWTAIITPAAVLTYIFTLYAGGTHPLSALALMLGAFGIISSVPVLRFSGNPRLAAWCFALSVSLGLGIGPLIDGDIHSPNLILLATSPVIFGFMIGASAGIRFTLALLAYYLLVLMESSVGANLLSDGLLLHWFVLTSGTVGCGFATVTFSETTRRDARRLQRLSDDYASLASRDPLTNILNRRAFVAALEQLSCERNTEGAFLLLIDLDEFKQINDTFGHDAGDTLLRLAAQRIAAELRSSAAVFRLGGDEFAILDRSPDAQRAAEKLGSRIVDAFASPFEINGLDIAASVSIGGAFWRGASGDTTRFYQEVDQALYRAKTVSGSSYCAYSADLAGQITRDMALRGRLRDAIADDQIKVWFQPQHRLEDGAIIGLEALARWHDDEFGHVSPIEFVTLAEQTGLVSCLDKAILDKAVATTKQWLDQGLERLAVNVSAASIVALDFPAAVAAILERHSFPANRLELEITETTLIENWVAAEACLSKLRKMGVALAIDDFGTGYSSLSYLSRFPVQRLKIDKSFIANAEDDLNLTIMTSIIQLSRSMGLHVIAEGIETRQHADVLNDLGCKEGQGYWFARPMDPEAMLCYFSMNTSTFNASLSDGEEMLGDLSSLVS